MKLPGNTTNAQVLTNMMQRLGDRKAAELRARVLFEANVRIGDLERGPTLPWFLQKDHSWQTVAGQRAYDLPTDFLREPANGRLIVRQDGAILGTSSKVDYADLALESGQPTEYALFGEKLYFGGIPDAMYDCTLDYYASTGVLVDNDQVVTNLWIINAYNLVTLYTLRLVAQFHIQAPDMAQRFDAELADATNKFWREVEARNHSGRYYKIED